MDDPAGFERSLAAALQRQVGPPRPIDAMTIAVRARTMAQRRVRAARPRLLVLAAALLVPALAAGSAHWVGGEPTPPPWTPSSELIGEPIARGVRLVTSDGAGRDLRRSIAGGALRPSSGMDPYGMNDVAFSPDGSIWALGGEGLFQFGREASFPPPGGWSARSDLTVGPDGTVWALLDGRVASFREDAWTLAPELGHRGIALEVTSDGTVWALTGRELARLDGAAWTRWPVQDALTPIPTYARLTAVSDDTLWTGPGTPMRFEGSEFGPVSVPEDLHVDLMAVGAGGELWVWDATSGGSFCHDGHKSRLARFDTSGWHVLADEHPVVQSDCYGGSMAVGADGRLWVTAADRIAVYDGSTWANVFGPYVVPDDADRTPVGTQSTLKVAPDGSIWLASGAGIIVIEGDAGRLSRNDHPSPAHMSTWDVAVGGDHACAVLDGLTWCWGDNGDGQLGVGGISRSSDPVRVERLGFVEQASAGAGHTCALAQGEVWCWGLMYTGGGGAKAGSGVARPGSHLPARVEGLDGVSAISAGGEHACALRDGEVWCWGHDVDAGGGFGPARRIEGIEGATAIAATSQANCALVDGQVWCWHLDQGVLVDSPPVRLGGLDGVTAIAEGASANRVCAVADGRLWCWEQQVDAWTAPHPSLEGVEGIIAAAAADQGLLCAITQEGAACDRGAAGRTWIPGATSVSAMGERYCTIVAGQVQCSPTVALDFEAEPPEDPPPPTTSGPAATPRHAATVAPTGTEMATFTGRTADGRAMMSDPRVSGDLVTVADDGPGAVRVTNGDGTWEGREQAAKSYGPYPMTVVRLVGTGAYEGLAALWEQSGDSDDGSIRGIIVPAQPPEAVDHYRIVWGVSDADGGLARHDGELAPVGPSDARLAGELSLTLDVDRGTLRIENADGAWQGPYDHVRDALSGWASNVSSTTVLTGEGAYAGLVALWEQRWWNTVDGWSWEVRASVIPSSAPPADG